MLRFLIWKCFKLFTTSQLEPQTRTDKLAVRAVCMSLHPCYMSLHWICALILHLLRGASNLQGFSRLVQLLKSLQAGSIQSTFTNTHSFTIFHLNNFSKSRQEGLLERARSLVRVNRQAEMAVKLSKTQNQELYSMIADNVKYSNV